MHKIEIVHTWKEIDTTWSETGTRTTVNQCVHCGTKQEVRHLGRDSGPSFRDSLDNEVLDLLRSTFDRWDEGVRSMKEMFEQLVHDSDHDSLENLITEIQNICQGQVDGSNLPYSELQRWVDGRKRFFQVKNLIAYAQGPVCNRCDVVFYSLDQLTVDHIIPDRSDARPSNLQLLCECCHNKKGKNPPDERDRSPFTYEGQVCEHKITCRKLDAMRRSRESAREHLAC